AATIRLTDGKIVNGLQPNPAACGRWASRATIGALPQGNSRTDRRRASGGDCNERSTHRAADMIAWGEECAGRPRPAQPSQFFVLSTNAFLLIHGIIARSFSPTCSIGCSDSRRRVALKLDWLTLFSSIQSRAKRPDWMSASTFFISFLVSPLMMRG